jgi:Lon protease-like protein
MIDNDLDLRGFSNVTRLFPLPGFVMFPHVVVPLHVFEPRYRQMTEDALATDRLITMIQVSEPPAGNVWSEPVPLEQVGCLGRIIRHQRVPDGRFRILLLGLKRVRLRRELSRDKLYRSARVDILEDRACCQPEAPLREELVRLFRQVFQSNTELDPDLTELLEKPVPLGVLADVVAHALALPSTLKQRLLAETSVDLRVESLRSVLQQIAPSSAVDRPFPPRFSTN